MAGKNKQIDKQTDTKLVHDKDLSLKHRRAGSCRHVSGTESQAERQNDSETGKQEGKQVERRTDRLTGRQTCRQTDKQTNEHAYVRAGMQGRKRADGQKGRQVRMQADR